MLHWFYNSSFLHINIRIFMNSCKFYQIRKTMYPILCRFRKKVPFDLFGWTACWSKSFKADLTSWICVKALLLQRTSLQSEIELPLQSTKLESESDFWWHFRVLCHARWETSGRCLFIDTYLHFFIPTLKVWRRGPVTQYGLLSSSFYAWYLLYDCEPIRGLRGSGFCQISGTRDCGT